VVFHAKDQIALMVGFFTVLLERVLLLLPSSIRFAFSADEHTSGQWADTYFAVEGAHRYEFDVPKYDKSQDMQCYEAMAAMMLFVGVTEDVIKFWQLSVAESTVAHYLLRVVFTTSFGNRSGGAGTIAINSISLLVAFLDTFRHAGVIALLIKGDDSVLITKHEIQDDVFDKMAARWGFTLKRRAQTEFTAFASSFFVKNKYDKYTLVRDPVRVIEKLGRALPADKSSTYLLDYFSSIVDTAIAYADRDVAANLVFAVGENYGRNVDVASFIGFIQHLAGSLEVFLKELYGMSDTTIARVRLDGAPIEVVRRRKAMGTFTKASALVDKFPDLRRRMLIEESGRGVNILDRIVYSGDIITDAADDLSREKIASSFVENRETGECEMKEIEILDVW